MLVLSSLIYYMTGTVLLICCCIVSLSHEQSSEDESSLKDALILVELLKAGHAKTLRDNTESGNKANVDTTFTEDDNSTCPTTIDDVIATTIASTIAAASNSTIYTINSGQEQNVSSSVKLSETSTTSTPTATVPQFRRSGNFKQSNVTKDENKKHKLSTGNRAHIRAQVASELAKEINETFTRMTTPEIPFINKIKPLMKTSKTKPQFPSTLRIHMASSTRYPIPFPENHAFCYFYPRNLLCGTML